MAATVHPMLASVKFEYATLVFDLAATFTLNGSKLDQKDFHRRLNEYGADGWELVNCFVLTRHDGMAHELTAVFKRPLA